MHYYYFLHIYSLCEPKTPQNFLTISQNTCSWMFVVSLFGLGHLHDLKLKKKKLISRRHYFMQLIFIVKHVKITFVTSKIKY